ncbi:dihydroxyacetone kinase family protein [Microlunatus flavus]|uniref:Dihydroxyacetone kinase n=1 Tax=Microlunatus flavus TaxID=1036181 RepID=A0A1H8ZEU8_9ACTN|nr:dihydroxyacetone kinase family protein [Microlunatus flavus]SEP62970.1 dihydroxyacetone kinase [Microlunatus flavus]
MTHVYDDPAAFKDDVLAGFALAYPDHVQRVPDASGFVRAGGPLEGKVGLVIGGGAGHYPSYNGVIGTGFADAAVLGGLFSSPSAEQVYRVCRAADGGAGVVMGFGNYAGDRLNFGVAADRLRAEGIDTRIVYVTDDIASAPPAEQGDRRGIAGTFTVYKIAGAASEAGLDLDGVERVMRAANAATFSFGVAFDGCTMPGAGEPLFHVERGRMDFGLGIHGEPGITSDAWMPAPDLAAKLVETVLAERPADADGRAAVLVNGLGATKYDELFVLFGLVAPLLEQAGVRLVRPEVGELVTSLDMAGCSLSVTWLDDELETFWTAPADTPAFRRGTPATSTRFTTHRQVSSESARTTVAEATEESRAAAEVARRALAALSATVEEHKDELGRLDAVAADGDHGIGMSRGALAATEAADATAAQGGGVQSVLAAAGSAFGDKAGGTSGILWGLLLDRTGQQLGNTDAVTGDALAHAVRSAADQLKEFSGADLGDKTMLDALFPFVDALVGAVDAGEPVGTAWPAAARTATEAARETAALRPRVGRARPLAERSVGTPDPGAVSLALIVTAVGDVLADAPVRS